MLLPVAQHTSRKSHRKHTASKYIHASTGTHTHAYRSFLLAHQLLSRDSGKDRLDCYWSLSLVMSDEPVAEMLLKVLSNLHYLVTGKAHLLQRGTRARQSGGTPRFEQGRDAGDKSRAEELSTQVLMCVCVCCRHRHISTLDLDPRGFDRARLS